MNPSTKRIIAAATLVAGLLGEAASLTATPEETSQWVAQFRALSPLPKIHYSWPVPHEWLTVPPDPLVVEYVRITHAVSVRGETVTAKQMDAAVSICQTVNATHPPIEATIAVNYSPWHRVFEKALPPTETGPSAQAELARFREALTNVQSWLADANAQQHAKVRVSAILLDSERFHVKDGDAAWNDAITDKLNAIYDIAATMFPEARIEWFGRGEMYRTPIATGWAQGPYLTLREQGRTFACALYAVGELFSMREKFRRTFELAQSHGINEVTPWVALGSGYRPAFDAVVWDFAWDYDINNSWMLGAELNIPWYGDFPERFAPWHAAKVVVFYPGPFEPRAPYWVKHFIAYVRGAHHIKQLL